MKQAQLFKTQKSIMLVLIFILFSCSEKENTDAAKKVEAPKLDIHAAVVTNNIDAVKQHIAAGTDINMKDQFGGSSPLISASLFGKTDIAKLLIDAGADLNVQNKDGSTALISAAFFCRKDIVKLLIENGADQSLKNNFGSTAYDSVAGEFEQVKGAYEMMKKMLGPMGLEVNFERLEKTRPEIAKLLKS